MKRTISIIIACVLCLMVVSAACGDGNNKAAQAPETEAPAEKPTGEPGINGETNQPESAVLTASGIYDGIMEGLEGSGLPNTIDMDVNAIENYYGLTSDDYLEASCHMPMMIVHATEISIFKVSGSGGEEVVTAGIDKRLSDLDEIWSQYLPDQYALVKNAKTIQNGDWILFVVAENADDIVAGFDELTK